MNEISEKSGTRHIGVIYPAGARSEHEMVDFSPDFFSLHFTRVFIPLQEVARPGAAVAYPDLTRGAAELAELDPDCVIWPCTSENIRHGSRGEYDQTSSITEACRRPVITAASSIAAALSHLNVRRIGLGGPYSMETLSLLGDFLRERGFDVIQIVSLGVEGDAGISALTVEDTCGLARDVDSEEAEAILISCGAMRIKSKIIELENELGKPIITTTMAVMWNTVRSIGDTDAYPSFGTLFSS